VAFTITGMNTEERLRLAESIRRARMESEERLQVLPETKKGGRMQWQYVFLVAALVCFLLGTFSVPVPRVNLVALGLALLVLSFMIPR
jgi:hypothetical protein